MKTNRNLVLLLAVCLLLTRISPVLAAAPAANSMKLNKTAYTMEAGMSFSLRVSAGKKLKGKPIRWSSSNPSVAVVSQKGNVTAVKKGKAKIIAKVSGTDKKAVCKVTVTAEKTVNISMEKAIALGQKAAEKYYDGLRLTQAYSYDNDTDANIHTGEDGKRQWWYVNFANKKDNYVSVLIHNGKIMAVTHFDSNGNDGLIDYSTVTLTGREAVKKAKALGLRGGDPKNPEDWVTGYNFKLSYASLAESPEERKIFLEVIGISPDGNFAHVDFDAVTGELLLAEEKIEYPNGDVEWKKL